MPWANTVRMPFFLNLIDPKGTYQGVIIMLPHIVNLELIIKIKMRVNLNGSFFRNFIILGIAINLNPILTLNLFPVLERLLNFSFLISHCDTLK